MTKKDRKGKKTNHRDLSPEPAPQPLEPENISDQIAPENTLPIIHQHSLEDAPSPVLNKRDRKGKKDKYRDLSPDPAPPTLEPEDTPDRTAPGDVLLDSHQQIVDETPNPALTKRGKKGKKTKYRDLSPDLVPQSREPEDISNQIASESALPTIHSIDDDANPPKPDPKALEGAMPVLDLNSEDVDLPIPHEQPFNETFIPTSTKKKRKGKKVNILDLAEDPPALSKNITDVPDLSALERTVPDPALSREELPEPGQTLKLDKRKDKGKRSKKRDLSPEINAPSVESANVPEPMPHQTELPPITTSAEDVDLPLSHDERLDETPIPELVKKDKKGKKSKKRDLLLDDISLPQETANMLDPSIADIPDPNLSLSQVETVSNPLPPVESSEKK